MAKLLMIYSLPRCGSTNFLHLLNLCSGGDILIDEPFHPLVVAQHVQKPPHTPAELPQALADLAQRWKGFKHVWNPDGWPFSQADLNQALLEQDLDVILLIRRNILQREVSNQISEQLQLWHPFTPERRHQFNTFAYQALDENTIDWFLRHEPILIEACRNLLRRGHKRWIELAYEDLYDDQDPLNRWQSFQQALDFAGIPCPGGQTQFEALLQSCYAKINTPANYARIPGIEAINLLYGSRETGYLFYSA